MADETTRTPDPNDTEAVTTPASETTGEDGRNETSEADYQKRQALENKVKAETLNALYASYGVSSAEELRERLAQSPAAPVETSPEVDDGVDWTAVEQFAKRGDPVAKAQLWNKRRMEELTQGTVDAFTARDIPDANERDQAIRHYDRERGRGRSIDLTAALGEVRSVKLAAELKKLQEENARLSKKPDPDVLTAPKTHGPSEVATPTKPKMTLAKAMAEAGRLRAEGKDHAAMLFLQAAEIEG